MADREPIAALASDRLGMHVIERTDRFTLIGADARRGKLTLFAAEAPRERGLLKHVGLRVNDVGRALPAAPGHPTELALGEGLVVRLVEAPTEVDFDLDHVALFSANPGETARAYESLGFAPAAPGPGGAPRVEVGGAWIELHEGDPGEPERPLLNHLAVLVDSAEEARAEAERLGLEIADWVDAPNTVALFLWGPERVKIEYVEHKPTFSLV